MCIEEIARIYDMITVQDSIIEDMVRKNRLKVNHLNNDELQVLYQWMLDDGYGGYSMQVVEGEMFERGAII